ncbi:MAG: sulfite exporter TauE/SafE family protein [Lachnospiraceae bacterium]|nr:sulfite exporter TauE/SafE family protein [Lachnospiraceae bacterium]
MTYFIAFLEGIITFISPCILPMLPLYISYFANGENNKRKTLVNALGFILGFTIVFVLLGAFAGVLGGLLKRYETIVNLVTGAIVVILGLNFTGLIKIGFLNGTRKLNVQIQNIHFFTSVLFGMIFAIGYTPCVGAFLGSALMMASRQGTMGEGILMLVIYSAGLGIPFLISAMLIDRLKATFQVIKSHYRVINLVSGIFLIVLGVLMMTGTFGYFLRMLRG